MVSRFNNTRVLVVVRLRERAKELEYCGVTEVVRVHVPKVQQLILVLSFKPSSFDHTRVQAECAPCHIGIAQNLGLKLSPE